MNEKEAEAYIMFKLLDDPDIEYYACITVDMNGEVYAYEFIPSVFDVRSEMWEEGGQEKYVCHLEDYKFNWMDFMIKLENA